MRITGGFLKGRKLKSPPGSSKEIRPLRTRIRKALFDTLTDDLTGWKVLDLFAGTGALGIEAISRGADFVLFVEVSPLAIKLIKDNIQNLGITEKTKILKTSLPEGLKIIKTRYPGFFDLVFVTPPYKKGLAKKCLEGFPWEVLKEKAVLVVEEHSEVPLPEELRRAKLVKKKTYGETTLHFYEVV